jgi:hypothetical protein
VVATAVVIGFDGGILIAFSVGGGACFAFIAMFAARGVVGAVFGGACAAGWGTTGGSRGLADGGLPPAASRGSPSVQSGLPLTCRSTIPLRRRVNGSNVVWRYTVRPRED